MESLAGEFLKSFYQTKLKLVAISHVSNGLGTINPIKYVIDNAKKFNAKV